MRRGYPLPSKETTAVSVAVGFGVAAVAGFGLGAALGAGVYGLSSATGKRGKDPLTARHIRRDDDGRIEDWSLLLKTAQQAGLAPDIRAELWPFLLGVFPPASTAADRAAELTRLQRLYTRLVLVCEELDTQLAAAKPVATPTTSPQKQPPSTPPRSQGRGGGAPHLPPRRHRRSGSLTGASTTPPGSAPTSPSKEPPPLPGNLSAFAEAHRIIVMDALRTDLSTRPDLPPSVSSSATASPVKPSAKPRPPTVTVLPVACGDGLPELMLVDPPEAAPLSPSAAVAEGRLPVWRSELAAGTIGGARHVGAEHRHLMMRLINVLSAYSVHDPETGYCQGMSDLAAVFVQLFDDDALAFACFERFMRSARQNFKHDETGIKHQLAQVARILADTDPVLHAKLNALGAGDFTFAYRMVVVMLRRELPLHAALTLWEVQWALEAGAEADREAAAAGAALDKRDSGGGGQGEVNGSPSPPPQPLAPTSTLSAAGTSGGASKKPSGATGIAATVQSMDAAVREAAALSVSSPTAGGSMNGRRTGSSSSGGLLTSSGSGRGSSKEIKESAPPPNFLLQFVAAVVRSQRSRVLADCHDTDDVLRLFNGVRIDFWTALAQARKQYKAYAQGLAVLQRL